MSGISGRYLAAAHNLGLLQELVRKDPESYKEEFLEQFRHYEQTLKLLELQPHQHRMDLAPLLEVVNFLATVAPCYPEHAKTFATNLIDIMRTQGQGLDPEVRLVFCKALVSLRNRNAAPSLQVLELFYELVKCEDKILRQFLFGSIAAQIKRMHSQKKDQKLITTLQSFTFAKLKDSRSIVARTAQLVLIDSYRKGFWRDAKTANAIADCCFHKVARMQVAAMKFFLGSAKDEEGIEEDDDDDENGGKQEDAKTLKEVTTAFRAAKKTRKKLKNFEKAKKAIGKAQKVKKDRRSRECNLIAINDLFDPQEFADRLFRSVESKKSERFEIRLLQIALTARVVGVHKLQTLGFYSFLHRYLQPKQREVTRILLYAAQAAHDLVPPDVIEQMVRVIAQNFITDRNTAEGITVGLNAVREILSNCPFAATEELLRDLTEYKKYKNKNVSMAARGLITLFRSINPKLLHRRDRGRPTEATKELETPQFGANRAKPFVPGAECLPEEQEDENDGWSDADSVDSDDDDDSNEWVDMPPSDEDEGNADEGGSEAGEPMSKIEKAKIVSETRILSQEDHRKITVHQLKKQLEAEKGSSGRKRKNDDVRLEEEYAEKVMRREQGDGLARLNDIEQFHKKIRRQTKEERLAMVKEGREGREDYNKPTKRGPHVGRTNRELAKHKTYQMVVQKQRGKNRQRSFRDQQQSLKKYLQKQKGMK